MLIVYPRSSAQLSDPPTVSGKVGGHIWHQRTNSLDVIVIGEDMLVKEVKSTLKALRDSQIFSVRPENPGNIIIGNRTTGEVSIYSDLLSTFPLYWSHTPTGLYVSDRFVEIASHCATGLDPVGLTEFLRFGYTIGARSLAKGVFRLQAGQAVLYSQKDGNVTSQDNSTLWTESQQNLDLCSATALGADLLVSSTEHLKDNMLMMSGGWDSRTLLAGALVNNAKPHLYNHGDIASRETRLVKSIADEHDLRLTCRQISAEEFSLPALNHYFNNYENVIFPHWHMAGIVAEELSVSGISAGIFGEILGGHYGPPMLASGHKKGGLIFQSILLGNTQKAVSAAPEAHTKALDFLIQAPYSKPWYFDTATWRHHFENIHEEVNSDIELALSRYMARGIQTTENLIEAFITEHRGSQYIGAQLHSAGNRVGYSAPFAKRSFIEFSCSVPFAMKVHNSLNRRIIRKLKPSLLDYPMAATLCKASRSIVVQEVSRAFRKCMEICQWQLHQRSGGLLAQPHLSWVNFQFLENRSTIPSIIDSLTYPGFDKHAMHAYVSDHDHTSYHPLMDMVLKIKSTDMLTQHNGDAFNSNQSLSLTNSTELHPDKGGAAE